VYLPFNCALLARHHVVSVMPWEIQDEPSYENRGVTDEEFAAGSVT
jgi:hypothetical protein